MSGKRLGLGDRPVHVRVVPMKSIRFLGVAALAFVLLSGLFLWFLDPRPVSKAPEFDSWMHDRSPRPESGTHVEAVALQTPVDASNAERSSADTDADESRHISDSSGVTGFAEKYATAEDKDLIEARVNIEARLHALSAEINQARIRAGDHRTVDLAPGEAYDPGTRPFGWAETVRGTSNPDGSQRLLVAGFAQAEHPQTKDLFGELLWLGEALRSRGSLSLLNSTPVPLPARR
jgi:hypothetical protein